VLHAKQDFDKALEYLAKADRLEPSNPQPKFQRSCVYVSMQKYELALKELEQINKFSPREASVHFAMGKIYKKLGQTDHARLRFLTALDLDPKDSNLVKSAIDKLHAVDLNDSKDDDDEL